MEYKYLDVNISNGIALVEIDRAPVNALNTELVLEIARCFLELDKTESVLAVILTGKGKAFVAGADISEMENMTPGEAEQFSAAGQNAMNAVAGLSKPVIAAVNGFALGGGCELAIACDIRLATPAAKLGQPEVKLGVVPGFGGTQRLPRLIGPGSARDLIFSGRVITADEALTVGLVDRLVDPAEDLIAAAMDLASNICKNGPAAVSLAKKLINDGLDLPLNAGLALERTGFSELFQTHDQKEGMKAFLEKRKPKFKD